MSHHCYVRGIEHDPAKLGVVFKFHQHDVIGLVIEVDVPGLAAASTREFG